MSTEGDVEMLKVKRQRALYSDIVKGHHKDTMGIKGDIMRSKGEEKSGERDKTQKFPEKKKVCTIELRLVNFSAIYKFFINFTYFRKPWRCFIIQIIQPEKSR